MAIDWVQWQAMRDSLDYCWVRLCELEREGPEGRAEYETVVQHALTTADRLLELSGAPPLSTAQMRVQWQLGRTEVMHLRERIAQADIARIEHDEAAALETARSDD